MEGFWNSLLTEKSWKLLQEFREKYDFILIGGWAVYLWAKRQKSKDIDIVVSIDELQKLKKENLIKNDRLKKYEIKIGEIDIDIYVSYFSELVIPVSDIGNYSTEIEGFKVADAELLLILKQGAEINRRNSVKGEKDKIDIVSMLFFCDIELRKYKEILKKYKKERYIDELLLLIRGFQEHEVFDMTPRKFKLKKKEVIEKLRRI